jgi:hypothetical protein
MPGIGEHETDRARAMAKVLANVPIIEGEKRVPTEYAINEDQAAVVREIFSMYADGKGRRGVAIELNTRGIPSQRPQTWHRPVVFVGAVLDAASGALPGQDRLRGQAEDVPKGNESMGAA